MENLMQENLRKLEQISLIADNWDGNGAKAFDKQLVAKVKDLRCQAGILGHSMTEMKAFFTSGFNTLKIRSIVLRLHFEYLQKKSIIAM